MATRGLRIGYGAGGDEPFFSDGFESGDFTHTENSGEWADVGTGISVQSSNPISGTQSVRYAAKLESEDDRQELYFRFGRDVSDLWVRFKIRIPSNFYHRDVTGTDNNKFLKLGSHFDGGSTQGLNLLWEYWPTDEGGEGSSALTFHWTVIGVDTGSHKQMTRVWGPEEAGTVQEFVMHAKVSSGFGVNDGVIQCWHKPEGGSFTRIHHYTTAPLYPQASQSTQNVWKGGYMFGYLDASYEEQTDFGLDDVKWAESNLWGVS